MTNTTNTSSSTEQGAKQKEGLCVEALEMRDYFAAAAMQGLLASGDGDAYAVEAIAANAYTIADAMLARREA